MGFESPLLLVAKDRAYMRRHWRVSHARGKASDQLCAGCCGRKAREWATIHGKSGDLPNDYVALCNYCHYEYDWPEKRTYSEEARENMSRAGRGKVISAETRKRISAAKRGKPLSDEAHVAMSLGSLEREKRSPNANAKLTFEDVRSIRSSSLSDRELANIYPVNVNQIARIRKRTAWRHVT